MSNGALALVIFGASGDLTARKLVPSLFRLDRKGRLPPELRVVGVARSPFSDDAFRDKMAGAVKEFAKNNWDEAAWSKFARRLHYVPGDATQAAGLDKLKAWLEKEGGGASGHWLYYLAVSPTLYPGIAKGLGQEGMSQPPEGAGPGAWRRLIIEKPFGRDLTSARALNQTLRQSFQENQIYRIDHYLGKETVQNILVFRFANTLFEPLWNYNYIDHVQITVSETVTMEGGRGDYYDKAGVLRDMFQNHLLQVLTLVAMEAPARFAADPLRNEKVKVLDAVPVYSPEEAAQNVCTGQYAGYHSEPKVAPGSRTPTYAALELSVDNWRWHGVPFFLRSGKAMGVSRQIIVLGFQPPPMRMFPAHRKDTPYGRQNEIVIDFADPGAIKVYFLTKVPGAGLSLGNAEMAFHYKDSFAATHMLEGYEHLTLMAMIGDPSLFTRSDGIERLWEISAPLLENPPPVQPYPVGSYGPESMKRLIAPYHWHLPHV